MSREKKQFPESDVEGLFEQVPSDFPRPFNFGALPGTQPKFLMTKYKGRFYVPGCTPPELYEQWSICEEYARQLACKSVESKAGKRKNMSEQDILEQYCVRFASTGWTTAAQARWVIRRVAKLLKWPVPMSSLEPSTNV